MRHCRPTARLALAALACLSAHLLAQEPEAPAVAVRVDPRVELMSVVFRLAGHPEYRQGKVDSYTAAVDAHFGGFADHAVVRRARQLRRTRGVSYDAVMSMAVHVTDASALGEAVPFEPRPAALDGRWQTGEARAFLADARRFAAEADFAAFFGRHRELYDTAVSRMQEVLGDAELAWFDRFFGARPSARFELALGMLNGGACYGPRLVHPDGREDLYCVLGVWQTDARGLPSFDRSMLATVVHEFCHSYCNHLVDAHWAALEAAADRLFPHVAEQMKAQAYGNARTMMCESLVRACVVRYLDAVEGRARGRIAAAEDARRGFAWTADLAQLLASYEAEREDHPTLDGFMPRVAAFFDERAAAVAEKLAAAPSVVSMVPPNGATDVDPATSAIVITFDRAMLDQAWSFVGGGPSFPETTGQPSYDRERKVLTLPVRLRPEHGYELWLNRGKFRSFESKDGVPLQPVHVRFTTGPAR